MAHFAKIGLNNKVIGVHVLHDNVLNCYPDYLIVIKFA